MCVCLKQTAARRTAPDYYIIIRCSTTLLIKQHTNQCHSLNDTIRVRPRTTLTRPRELFTCELAAGGSIYASRYVHLSTTVRTQRSSLGGATHQNADRCTASTDECAHDNSCDGRHDSSRALMRYRHIADVRNWSRAAIVQNVHCGRGTQVRNVYHLIVRRYRLSSAFTSQRTPKLTRTM